MVKEGLLILYIKASHTQKLERIIEVYIFLSETDSSTPGKGGTRRTTDGYVPQPFWQIDPVMKYEDSKSHLVLE